MSRLVAFAAIAFCTAVMLSACDVHVTKYEVRNSANTPILFSVFSSTDQCSMPGTISWQRIDPGQTRSSPGFMLSSLHACLLIADQAGRVFFSDTQERGGVFEVRAIGAAGVRRTGDSDGYTFDAGWILLIVLVPLLIGLGPAAYITARFFYRYYVSKSIRPAPAEPVAPA